MSDNSENSSTLITSNHLGSAPTWITSEYLEEMLKKSLKGDLRVENFEIGPGSAVGDNYACQLFRIQINCVRNNRKETRSIIAKAVPNTDLAEELQKGFDLYTTEIKMTSETLPILYEELRSKIDVERFFPVFHKIDSENKMFFMEDLKPEGYVLADKKASLDLDHVTLVVKAQAQLHAASYLYLQKNPEYKKKYWKYFWSRHNEGTFMQKMCSGMRKCLLESLDQWPLSSEDKEIIEKLPIYDLLVDNYERKESSFNVLVHGDCWINNMMFKYENGKVASVKLIDYQLSNYNSIGCDLNYFLFSSAQEYVKLKHLEDVLKIYYDEFVRVTGEIKGFSLDTVRKEFQDRLGFGIVIAIFFRSGVLADAPFDIDAYLEGRESKSNSEMYQNKNFISEAVKLLPIFKKHGVFK